MANPDTERVRVIEPGQTYLGKQGFTYIAGASAETVGAEHICMNILPMADGARAKVHYHRGVETIAYLLEGECSVYYGESLERRAAGAPATRFSFPRTWSTRRATKAVHPVHGSWCTPAAAIRKACSSYRSVT